MSLFKLYEHHRNMYHILAPTHKPNNNGEVFFTSYYTKFRGVTLKTLKSELQNIFPFVEIIHKLLNSFLIFFIIQF